MSTNDEATGITRWKRRCLIVLALWALSTILLSFPKVRGVVARPLYVSDGRAKAEVAYVMSDGFAYWERLYAASDLYHMKRVSSIVIAEEDMYERYSFVRNRSEPLTQRATAFLGSLGVPEDKVKTIRPAHKPLLGSWSEAVAFSEQQYDVSSVVVVTSAPHTRRSLLCFRRALPEEIQVSIYAPTVPAESWEVSEPIWLEYIKLAAYSLFVW